jgi:hypothetical protein
LRRQKIVEFVSIIFHYHHNHYREKDFRKSP